MKRDRQQPCRRFAAAGFSLVEFMVAMVLGLIIIGGAISVYLASKRSFTEVEQVASVSENGRFAVQVLNYAAKHVGFFGSARPADIREDGSLGAVGGNCTGGAAAYDTNNAFFAVRATGASMLSCITDARPNSDILVIKGVVPSPLYDEDPNDPNAPRDGVIDHPAAFNNELTYVVANSERGLLLDGADTAPDVREGNEFALATAWPYRLQIFYVRDDVNTGPVLARKVLAWDSGTSAMAVQTQDLVQGVESMRFLFSYDTGVDGIADTVGNLATVQAAGAWANVTSMEAFILLRNQADDPAYVNEKSYRMGDLAPIAPADNFRRVLLHSEITLRNNRLVLRGGT